MKKQPKVRLAIFASGAGSNARAITQYFKDHPRIDVVLIVTNRHQAGVVNVAGEAGVDWVYIPKADFEDPEMVLTVLREYGVDWIILAGWLLLVPDYLIAGYRDRIVNIHPALLPKFGGKGMYGHHVHEAVKRQGETETGITVHIVNERFDEGPVIHQEKVSLSPGDTSADIERKVRQLELRHYPQVIEKVVLGP